MKWDLGLQYMDNVNRYLWRIGLPILALIYLCFLVFEHSDLQDENRSNIAAKHQANSSTKDVVDGVILGGSNAAFSLSANMLNDKNRHSWLNLSLLNEGFTDENYWTFIEQTLSENQRFSVKEVVYSSITPLRTNFLRERNESSADLYGAVPLGVLPSRSIAGYLKALTFKNGGYPLPTSLGDFDFSKFECNINDGAIKFERNLNEQEVDVWVQAQLTKLTSIFPKSVIYFVVPSEFYGKALDERKAYQSDEMLRNSVEEFNKNTGNKIVFIRQKFFPSKDLICDDIHHANQLGRIWRTNELAKRLGDSSR